MIFIPCYDLVILPGITYYFEKDYFKQLTDADAVKGEDVVFLILKEAGKKGVTDLPDFYETGVSGRITGIDRNNAVSVDTSVRVGLKKEKTEDGGLKITYEPKTDIVDLEEEEENRRFSEIQQKMIKAVGRFQWGIMARSYILNWKKLDEMVASLSGYLGISNEEKYAMLETDSRALRFERMEHAVKTYLEMLTVSTEAQAEQKEANEQIYREAALKKQIEILQKKLDEMHPENLTDIRKFEMGIESAGMNSTAEKEARKVLERMKIEGENGHEYGMLYDYLDFMTGLSWKKEPYAPVDLTDASRILDEDHFGLQKVKKRILQQLAVIELNRKQSGSILLFVGPPGTGKTSIGQSIARACGRKYVRISLGGVRDEAEIRGHRRTYIGAMPGRIMDGMKRSGVSNPVMVLDEVDKLIKDYNGDPSSALLEALDPEQNSTFTDHYMNVPYDLSDVLFICTANSTDTIPEPLLNRMEVIRFQGYTETEKLQIARKHLIPKSMKQMGIKPENLKISDAACHSLISDYTMEAGVRGLKKQIDTLCRSAAVKLVKGEQTSIKVSPKQLRKFLDVRPITHEHVLEEKQPGIVTGLAWTQAGGDILFIETMLVPGEEKTIITGQLGDVMKESARIARTVVKNIFPDKAEAFKGKELHIHVPAGAVPKDGPSAGITLTTALASLLTGKSVDPGVAMTGEISLRGIIMPIGGLPEKLMAAVRAGVKTVFIPKDNMDDLEDVDKEVKEKLTIVPVHDVTEVLRKTGLL